MAGGKLWTDDEVNIITEGYKNGEPINDILKKLPGRTRGAVTSQAVKLGLSDLYVYKNSSKFKAEYQDYDWLFQRIIVDGKTTKQISEETGYSERVIKKWADQHRLNNRTFKELASLTPIQRSLIIGGVLGDGHICLLNESALYIESHAINQKDYLFWKYDILKNLCLSEPAYYDAATRTFNGKEYLCQPEYRFQTRLINELLDIKKMSRYELIDNLDELSMSTHFLDDASFDGYVWELCFGDWTMDEEKYYIETLKNKFNIEMHIANYDNRYASTNNKEVSKRLNDIILNNVPNSLDIISDKIIKKVS